MNTMLCNLLTFFPKHLTLISGKNSRVVCLSHTLMFSTVSTAIIDWGRNFSHLALEQNQACIRSRFYNITLIPKRITSAVSNDLLTSTASQSVPFWLRERSPKVGLIVLWKFVMQEPLENLWRTFSFDRINVPPNINLERTFSKRWQKVLVKRTLP